MLTQLSIYDFAIIKNAVIEFDKKLNAITGETGAGKSIIVDALSLALGYRANKESIRQGAQKTTIQAVFDIEQKSAACFLAREMGIEIEDQIIFTRQIYTSGKNICRINSILVTVQELKTLGSVLVDIHGQHEHQYLLNTSTHIKYLDKYDEKVTVALENTQSAYYEYMKAKDALDNLIQLSQNIQKEKEKLEHDISVIEAAQLNVGEDKEIEKKITRLKNYNLIYENTLKAYELIYNNERSVLEDLQQTLTALYKAASADESLLEQYERLLNIVANVEDVSGFLRDYIAKGDFENENIDDLEGRAYLIAQLKRQYNASGIEEILDLKNSMIKKLETVMNLDNEIENKSKEETAKKEQYFIYANELSKLRRQIKITLEKNILKQLRDMSMPDASFKVDIKRAKDTKEIRKNGYDDIEFLFSSNKGFAPKSLSKIVSGGEMSRIMLAFKILIADKDITTLIFDEIDTGISGRTAQVIAQKLKKLSSNYQVILITHLPQIASVANVHFCAKKTVVDQNTVTELIELNGEGRVYELAKMVGGVDITQETLNHARQMLQMASNLE
jgi:DNA repair protein RecN (Recombination protein N)